MTAKTYRQNYLPKARQLVGKALATLKSNYDVLVIEGAGSAAEVNLRDGDIVNMATAELADSPVILVADIDRGGVFASIVGTLELLLPEERERVVGLIVNKFRGDLDLFKTGIDFLEERTGLPVLGVIPYLEHGIAEEDSASLVNKPALTGKGLGVKGQSLGIKLLQLPRMANFSQFHLLNKLPESQLHYVKGGEAIGETGAVIIPDTNNPLEDLKYLKEKGYDWELKKLASQGVPILGIGAGFYLLSESIRVGNNHLEKGLNLLGGEVLLREKGDPRSIDGPITFGKKPFWGDLVNKRVAGFDLGVGDFQPREKGQVHLKIGDWPGLYGSQDGLILGTEFQGFLADKDLLITWVNKVRERNNLPTLSPDEIRLHDQEKAFSQLADHVRTYLNIPLLYELMGLS